MKYCFFIASSLAFVLPALAQDITSLPQCSQPKVLDAIGSSGCSLVDIQCICGNQEFIDGLLVEIPKVCTPDEVVAATNGAVRICAAYGVTLSLPGATSAASSAVPSTTSGSISSITSSASIGASSTASEVVSSVTEASATATSTSGSGSNSFSANYFVGVAAMGFAAVF